MPIDEHQEVRWLCSAASVRGKSHIDADLPNQDSVHVETSDAGDVVCAVVSDGAGSAPRAEEGSTVTARHIAACMRDFGVSRLAELTTAEDVRIAVERSIEEVRETLSGEGTPLSLFHSTCVLWLSLPTSTYVAQIGDSICITTCFKVAGESGNEVDFFPKGSHTLHSADRGEYANETHFLTECDWRAHLRVVEVDARADAILLMTDGAMDVALARGQVFRGFLSNLVGKLLTLKEISMRNQIIETWLAAPQTYPLTGDDKTLFVAIRSAGVSWAGLPVCVTPQCAVSEPG